MYVNGNLKTENSSLTSVLDNISNKITDVKSSIDDIKDYTTVYERIAKAIEDIGGEKKEGVKLLNYKEFYNSGTDTTLTCNFTNLVVGQCVVVAYYVRLTEMPTISEDWIDLGGSNTHIGSTELWQVLRFCYKIVENTNETLTITQSTSDRMGAIGYIFSGVENVSLSSTTQTSNNSLTINPIADEKYRLYALTSCFVSGSYQFQQIDNFYSYNFNSSNGNIYRLPSFISNGVFNNSVTFVSMGDTSVINLECNYVTIE